MGQTFTRCGDRRLIPRHIGVAVGMVQVCVFNLHGRRQNDIRITRGIRMPVLHYDGKKVFSRQPLADADLVWVAGNRIAGITAR